MKLLYDNLSARVSKITTRTYSTSFSLGIYFLNHRIRDAIYAIYGFVRLADEIVDSFNGYEQKYLLDLFRQHTSEAVNNRISVNPILNSFQHTVHQYRVDRELINLFLDSMEMDLENKQYDTENYRRYILGSAEAVGLMCLYVFTEGNETMYNNLKPYAMKLGAAFQKVNFLRDLKEDYHTLGRTYFPGVDITCFTDQEKKQIEQDIEQDFDIALKGIKKLPASSRGGVYLAYITYRSLFNKIKKLPAQHILTKRVRIHNGRKLGLALNSMVQHKFNWL